MSEYFKGVTFANQHLSPADDAVIRRRLIADGVLTGCEISHSRDTLSMAPGYLMACGREILHPSAENWTVTYSPATSKTASGSVIDLSDASSGPLQGLRIYGRTTQDGTPTPDNPVELVSVGDGGSVGVTVAGKNIVDNNWAQGMISITDGVTVSTNSYWVYNKTYIPVDGSIQYTVSSETNNKCAVIFYDKSHAFLSYVQPMQSSAHVKLKMPENAKYLRLSYNLNGAAEATTPEMMGTTHYIQIDAGATATAYEPYTAQTLPISTPNGLPGIPVTSGGNYTDADGQQWICDEVDFARGVYVQRVYKGNTDGLRWIHERNGSNFYECRAMLANVRLMNGGVMSTHFAKSNENKMIIGGSNNMLYARFIASTGIDTIEKATAFFASNSVTFIAALYTPIETPIPEAELTAYAALHTNRPNTTVYNDAGAHMEVGYYPQDDAIPSNGYARILLTVDLTRTASADVFDQVNTSIEYADTEDGFPSPVQDDINSGGPVYQLPLAVVSIEDGAITGITDSIGNAEPI